MNFEEFVLNGRIGGVFQDFIEDFNNALSFGVKNIDLVTERYGKSGSITGMELRKYLTENIDFFFDNEKKKAMDLFLDLLKRT